VKFVIILHDLPEFASRTCGRFRNGVAAVGDTA
jgi:hypothetical protein